MTIIDLTERKKKMDEINELLRNAKNPIEFLEAQIRWFKEVDPEGETKVICLIKLDYFKCNQCPKIHSEISSSTFIDEKYSQEHSKLHNVIKMCEVTKTKAVLRDIGIQPVEAQMEIEDEEVEGMNQAKPTQIN